MKTAQNGIRDTQMAKPKRSYLDEEPEVPPMPEGIVEKTKALVSSAIKRLDTLTDDDIVDFLNTKKGKIIVGVTTASVIALVGITYLSVMENRKAEHKKEKLEKVVKKSEPVIEAPKSSKTVDGGVPARKDTKKEEPVSMAADIKTVEDFERAIKAFNDLDRQRGQSHER